MAPKFIREVDAVTKEIFPHYPDAEQITEFYCALGVSMSAWAFVESTLYFVFERATRPGKPGAAGSAFHALQHSNSKITATDAAVRFALLGQPEELQHEWRTIRRKLNNRLERRNHFAHFQVFTFVEQPKREDRIILRPMFTDYRYAVGIKDRCEYRIHDILSITGSFFRVAQRLAQFLSKIPQS